MPSLAIYAPITTLPAMYTFRHLLFSVAVIVVQGLGATAQISDSSKKAELAVFIPLYLDSAFYGFEYLHGTQVPRYVLPGLEFYHGVKIAADSLAKAGIPLTIRIIDSRLQNSFQHALNELAYSRPGLIIGMVQNAQELKAVADLAHQSNIPFISATYPNDAGLIDRPNTVVLNSTIKTHLSEMYRYLQRNYATEDLLYITRRGINEDRIAAMLKESQSASALAPVRLKTMTMTDTLKARDLQPYLDSTRRNVIVCGTTDEKFSKNLLKQLSSLTKNYPIEVFGMPNWADYPLTQSEFKGLTVYHTSPFVPQAGNAYGYEQVVNQFKKHVASRPSDMAFRGYETTLRFGHTLVQYGTDFLTHINDSNFRVFNNFRIEPGSPKPNGTVDCLENKKVYFVKRTNGVFAGAY
jgi:hypothetical protein